MHRLLKIEWDAIAGVLAAVTAIVLHFLDVIDTEVLSRRLLGYAITFVLDQQQRPKWERDVWSKVLVCGGAGKVAKPVWSGLPGGCLVHTGRHARRRRHRVPAQLLERALHVPTVGSHSCSSMRRFVMRLEYGIHEPPASRGQSRQYFQLISACRAWREFG